jgi:hypothetical protein
VLFLFVLLLLQDHVLQDYIANDVAILCQTLSFVSVPAVNVCTIYMLAAIVALHPCQGLTVVSRVIRDTNEMIVNQARENTHNGAPQLSTKRLRPTFIATRLVDSTQVLRAEIVNVVESSSGLP